MVYTLYPVHLSYCNNPKSITHWVVILTIKGKSPTESLQRFVVNYAIQHDEAPCVNPRAVIVRLASGMKENFYMD